MENISEYSCVVQHIINRWIAAAAHCYNDFGVAEEGPREVKIK